MAKAKDYAKNLFHMVKGKGLERSLKDGLKDIDGKSTVGEVSPHGFFNIGSFRSSLEAHNSLYRPNRYLVKFKRAPNCIQDKKLRTQATEEIIFFCDNINIPGASIIPVDYKRYGIGPFDRRASNIVPAEISAAFMLDGLGRNLHFFQKWVSNIVYMGNADKAPGLVMNRDSVDDQAFGEIAYRKDYITEMEIETYDQNAQLINRLTAHEVWPSQLGDVTLGWAQNDEVGRVTVNLQVQRWTVENYAGQIEEKAAALDERILSPMERLLRITQAARSLQSSWKKPDSVGDVINLVSNSQTFLNSFGKKQTARFNDQGI